MGLAMIKGAQIYVGMILVWHISWHGAQVGEVHIMVWRISQHRPKKPVQLCFIEYCHATLGNALWVTSYPAYHQK